MSQNMGGHSRIIFKTAGYVKTTKGNYIALLEYRMALFILLALLLITGTVFAVHSAMNKDVKAPDVAKATNKKNVVYIYLPSGKVQYRMKSDVSGFEGYRLKLFIKDKDGRHKVHRQKVELDENGNIADSQINFRSLHYELKEGKYKGRIRLRQGENRERLKATVYVVSAKSGSSEVSYKKYIRVNRSKGIVKFLYKQGEKTSHSAIIQLILKNEDREVLLAQSGILYPGNKITRLNLNDGAASDLSAGNYKGIIRVYVNNGDETNKKIRADIDQIVIVK